MHGSDTLLFSNLSYLKFNMLSILFAIDSSVGRIDKSTLSQQTLMELLISNIPNKGMVYGFRDEYLTDITKWDCIVLNDSNEVIEIEWDESSLIGSIDLQNIPPTVTRFQVNLNKLEGSLNLTALPKGLEKAYFGLNRFSGEISLQMLPESLKVLDVGENNLRGCVNLTQLPVSLETLGLAGNQFGGTLDLTNLPEKLEQLFLSDNLFEGKTDFQRLPTSLKLLDISDTKLSGEIILRPGFRCENSNTDVNVRQTK